MTGIINPSPPIRVALEERRSKANIARAVAEGQAERAREELLEAFRKDPSVRLVVRYAGDLLGRVMQSGMSSGSKTHIDVATREVVLAYGLDGRAIELPFKLDDADLSVRRLFHDYASACAFAEARKVDHDRLEALSLLTDEELVALVRPA